MPLPIISAIRRSLRNSVKSAGRAIGFEIMRSDRVPQHTLNLLHLACTALLAQAGTRPVIVQIGANDGVTRDPLRPIILKHGLVGVVVEPEPRAFEQLVRNYHGVPGLAFENAAIAPTDGHVSLYTPIDSGGLGTQIAGFDREHLVRHGVKSSQIRELRIPCLTLPTLLAKHAIVCPDVLLIDTEGYDLEIVRMAFSAGVYPPILHFEHCHLPPADKEASRILLTDNGYLFTETTADTLALAKSIFT